MKIWVPSQELYNPLIFGDLRWNPELVQITPILLRDEKIITEANDFHMRQGHEKWQMILNDQNPHHVTKDQIRLSEFLIGKI